MRSIIVTGLVTITVAVQVSLWNFLDAEGVAPNGRIRESVMLRTRCFLANEYRIFNG